MMNDGPGPRAASPPVPAVLPKLCGADIELGNFLLGASSGEESRTGAAASQALLREIQGLRGKAFSGYDPQDTGRKFLSENGGCAYIDLDHLELCLPEVRSSHDHVACWHAMLRIAQDALDAANERLPSGRRIKVLVNNSDGHGHSYGSHLSVLITRRAFGNIFQRKLHQLIELASFFASSIVFTGAGKVGSENGREEVRFQISQRADFFETLTGEQTTYRRPIINSRDEPLAEGDTMARFHCIFFDSTLCHGSSLLKVGVTQLVLAMVEQEQLRGALILDDPLEALHLWSRDPSLQAAAPLASGSRYRAVELQWAFFEKASRFVAAGRAEGLVPRAEEVLALWEDTLKKLEHDLHALIPRLDWVLKRAILERAIREQGLRWDSPEVKHLDHLYSSLDPSEGLYWTYERLGAVERIVPAAAIERFVHEPPEDTRAWTRAHLMRLAGPEGVRSVDWDHIRFAVEDRWRWICHRTCELPDPLAGSRSDFARVLAGAASIEEALDRLAGKPAGDAAGRPGAGPAPAPLEECARARELLPVWKVDPCASPGRQGEGPEPGSQGRRKEDRP